MRKSNLILTFIAAMALMAASWTVGLTNEGTHTAHLSAHVSATGRQSAARPVRQLMQPGFCVVAEPIAPNLKWTCSVGNRFLQVAHAPMGGTVTIATKTPFCRAAGELSRIDARDGRFSCAITPRTAKATVRVTATDFCETSGGNRAVMGNKIITWGCEGIPTTAKGGKG
jgi:hypothetical protein